MTDADLRARFAAARVAHFATVRSDGSPHLVPITFALAGERIVSAVDHKPKRSAALQRLANIRADARVAVLADAYDEDWTRLWWVRADGTATLLEPGEEGHEDAVEALAVKYEQYRQTRPTGTVISVSVDVWRGWTG